MLGKGKKLSARSRKPTGVRTKRAPKRRSIDAETSSTAGFFSGPDELKRLKDPPNSETLLVARSHIVNIVLHGGENGFSSSPRMAATKKAHFLFAIEQSMEHLPNYATLDFEHIRDIVSFTTLVEDYVADTARTQPINWVMLASPGEGKSHFIDCIAEKLKDKLGSVLFNMASMRQSADLESALDRARNVTIEGKIPLIFLDEFDSDERNYSLLLPLLWDGEIELGSRRLKIGRAVIVLAGSNPALPDVLEQAASMKDEKVLSSSHNPKLVDLFSRINGGVITIPSLREVNLTNHRDRRIDKVCVAIALLRRKYGDELKSVPSGLLCFIYHMTFRYGVRSIQHLIELLGNSKPEHAGDKIKAVDEHGLLNIAGLKRIFERVEGIGTEGLVYHLIHPDQAAGIQETWKTAFNWDESSQSFKNDRNVPVWCRAFKEFGRPTSWKQEVAGSFAMQMVKELGGELLDGRFVDVTTFAGIEPLHITQLWLSPDDGEWQHGNKEMRHVFFNLNTLHEILSEVIAHSKPPREVGRRMGIRFGSDFLRFLGQLGDQLGSVEAVIDHWCRFDVSGGWGKWERSLGASELHVRNNFLAEMGAPSREKKSRFCTIMEGYIQGVLEEIAKAVNGVKKCSVEVRESSCGISNAKEKPCKFKYTIKY